MNKRLILLKMALRWQLFLLLIFLPWPSSANEESEALIKLKNSLQDPRNTLQSWDQTAASPCTWFHVTCDINNNVIRLDLGNSSLSGALVSELGQLRSLQYLELYGNSISGPIPPKLAELKNLISLDLYQNNLTDQIPRSLGSLSSLHVLRLNNNRLIGQVPETLAGIKNLEILDVSTNNLSGNVPLVGSFSSFTLLSFKQNPLLCGPLVAKACNGDPPYSPPPFVSPPPDKPKRSIPVKAIAGVVAVGIALLCVASAIGFAHWRRRKSRDHFYDVPGEENPKIYLGQLKRFSLRELHVATDGFSSNNILGSGGFGKVYKGRLADGSLVAVKRLKEGRTSGGELQFQTEMEMISMAVHRNLLRLRGFCMTTTERMLVYPFMKNGSVASCIQGTKENEKTLDWITRKRIALGSARGLAYLHEQSDPKIIHRDVKAANILLDEEFEAVVGDFGLAKLMDYTDTHVTTVVRGTIGHIAPEYLSTGKSSEKTDVYGYGIMLLELMTGQRAFDLARLANDEDVMLLDWVKGQLANGRLDSLVSPDLKNNYIEAEELFKLALLCTRELPMDRPKMSKVVQMLEVDGIAKSWEEWQRTEIESQLPSFSSRNMLELIPDSTWNLPPDELSGPR